MSNFLNLLAVLLQIFVNIRELFKKNNNIRNNVRKQPVLYDTNAEYADAFTTK